MVLMKRQSQLLEVVDALHPPGCLARGLDGGQEQGDQHGDDGDDHEQLDERETAVLPLSHGWDLYGQDRSSDRAGSREPVDLAYHTR
jgi:hypothetical protein